MKKISKLREVEERLRKKIVEKKLTHEVKILEKFQKNQNLILGRASIITGKSDFKTDYSRNLPVNSIKGS